MRRARSLRIRELGTNEGIGENGHCLSGLRKNERCIAIGHVVRCCRISALKTICTATLGGYIIVSWSLRQYHSGWFSL